MLKRFMKTKGFTAMKNFMTIKIAKTIKKAKSNKFISLKRCISAVLTVSVMLSVFNVGFVFADESEIFEIKNEYIKVIVNGKNGGYVISTLEGDILKKSDDNVSLTHRGENYDTSFTSFKIDGSEYVFGEKYGILSPKGTDVATERDADGNYIKSTWSIDGITVEQTVSLVNNTASEQLGTAMITYTVKNASANSKNVKSRVLMDTQLGENDYGYYEVPNQRLGQGYKYFEFEETWDSSKDPTVSMPADYFVRDNPYSSNIVAYGVNSVFDEQKPYKMTFAHWANIAATVFDYEPDRELNFTNNINKKKTADSAAALYYDLGTIAAGGEKSFSTYYGVTANLKNKENKIILNTAAPSKLEFKDGGRDAYKGSENGGGTYSEDNVVRINVNLTNPKYADKDYKKLAVVVYALGFDTQRRKDSGAWEKYSNSDPIYSEIIDFKSGENRVTYFDFKFEPQERAQLGTFVIKVFDMDENVNELGYYAEEYCLATSENHIILPGRDANLPTVTLSGISPEIIYNQDVRYITVNGRGMEFLRSDLLEKISLCGDDGDIYEIPFDNLIFEQGDNPNSVSIMLDEYMQPGRYQLHFIWRSDKTDAALEGVPKDFTSDGMYVQISGDIRYYNASYGVVAVCRGENNKYKIMPYKNEAEFENAKIDADDLLLSFRGDILRDKSNNKFFRLYGKDKDININHILNYHGDDLTLEEKDDGTVEILMDGKITTVGANTTVRNGTAAFRLNSGTEYIVPEYNERGETETEKEKGQDYIELKWDNAFDTLTTVGGFLIDMKYGVLGKIKNSDKTTSDIISFGGRLDLSFITPGGAAAVRQNTEAGAKWTTKGTELKDDSEDGYSFGLTFDEDEGMFKSQVAEKDIPPTNEEASRVEAGAEIYDILYGGKNPGYIGINMAAHAALPQLVKFLPNKIEGNLEINTIGGYRVGVDASVETGNIAMAMSLVVKSSPSGAPVPDKLYFTIGGFEPGINVDNMGVLWVTGGGGGLDNLYDTIYGKDGVPPLTVLLHVEFDITKIMTGSADLELSLRSLKLSFSDISLKMLPDAKFLDGGEVAVGWYPNFNLNLSGSVNFGQIMKGGFAITAAAGKDTADFVQFVLNVAIGLPDYIPIVGGMELASAELGGGSQKVWGSVEMLSLIKVGFTYYWGGSIEFTHGNASGTEDFAALSALDDDGVKRTKLLYNKMLEPIKLGTDPSSGEEKFASIGGNLSYSAGSRAVADFDERVKNAFGSGVKLADAENLQTEIFTSGERERHLINFGDANDYILSISPVNGTDTKLSAEHLTKYMTVKKDGNPYELRYYTAPEHTAADDVKKQALESANINVTEDAAYIVVPKSDAAGSMLIEFSDGGAYDIGAIKVNPVGELKECGAQVNGADNTLSVSWKSENASDNAKIIVSAFDGDEKNAVVLNENEIFAKANGAVIKIPDKLASGSYKIKLTLSDEDKTCESFDAGTVSVKNAKAPDMPQSVSIENFGDDKMKITVGAGGIDFDGYLVEVYEDGKLADTGLYFEKGEEIVVGGRYAMPIFETDQNGNTVFDADGNPKVKETVTVGYTSGRKYSAKVRLCNIEKDADGNEIYHSSAYVKSDEKELLGSTPPRVAITYDKSQKAVKIESDTAVNGELYINSAGENGLRYELSGMKTEYLQNVNLEDGEYTAEVYLCDAEGDHCIKSEIISVDTTPPVIMIASPVSGESFDGDEICVIMTQENGAEYTFKANGISVLPQKTEVLANGMKKYTFKASGASVNLEICAEDEAGNKAVKNLFLINEKISDITSVSISCEDKTVIGGKLILGEDETARLKILGTTSSGKTIDVSDMSAAALEVVSGVSASLENGFVTAKSEGRTLIRAGLALGGNEFLYDGIIVETTDKTLIFTALNEVIAEGRQKAGNEDYTEESRRKLIEVIDGAEKLIGTEGITQKDIDNAATAVSNAIADLKTKGSPSSSSGDSAAYYTVLFNTGGAAEIKSQRIRKGQTAAKPTDPERAGYVFGGWYTDKQFTVPYDFADKVTKSFTLYAKWTKNENGGVENPFADVNADDWFFGNVEYVFKNGLMSGISANEFAPNGTLTRAMLVTVLYRAEGEPDDGGEILFADVLPDAYYADAVAWAHKNGIVSGVSADEFAPDENITREQIAAIMHRYAKYKGYDVKIGEDTNILSFDDAESISEYAFSAMQYAVGAGIIKGKTDNRLSPSDTATRAEAAAILQRFIEENK